MTGIDRPRIEAAVAEILAAIGEDPSRPGLSSTPSRVADAYGEFFSGVGRDAADDLGEPVPLEGDRQAETVLLRDIEFRSVCEHHLLPFVGVAHIAYLPGARILGLSKLARVLDYCSRDLQVQERLTTQVADWLEERLAPRGVGVVLEAEHMCMSLRGVHATGTTTVTSALRGSLRDDHRRREEFLSMAGVRR